MTGPPMVALLNVWPAGIPVRLYMDGQFYSMIVSHDLNYQAYGLCIVVTVNSISLMQCSDVLRVRINSTCIGLDHDSLTM